MADTRHTPQMPTIHGGNGGSDILSFYLHRAWLGGEYDGEMDQEGPSHLGGGIRAILFLLTARTSCRDSEESG